MQTVRVNGMNRISTRTLVAATVATFLILLATRTAHSGTTTASLQVGIVVSNNCSITTSAVQFSAYDPSVSNASTPATSAGSVTLACTQGSAPVIGLGSGAHQSGATRRASDGANFIAYQLYKDGGLTQPWGDSGTDVLNAGLSPSKRPRSFTVHGQVPAGQNVPSGTYSDTITVSVNF
ncbi:MAG: spore coat protein U domain-containing protein [Acidobacteria bacterium]|nr:spore coat protein U domain-containing protein [Acidobacteriota bacterium]